MFRKDRISIITFFFFVAAIIALSIVYEDSLAKSVFVAFTILFILGIIINRGQYRELFLISFFTNITVSVIFYFYFIKVNGNPFMGDEQVFYNFSKEMYLNGTKNFAPLYTLIPYKAYLLILSQWMKLLKIIGMGDPAFSINLRLLNSFVGGFIPVISYKIFSLIFERKQSKRFALLIAFFPLTIYYSATLLRDLYITIPFLLIVYFTLAKRYSKSTKLVVVISLGIFAYFIRPASAVMIASFPFFYEFFKYEKNGRMKLIKQVFTIIVFSGSLFVFRANNDRNVDITSESYAKLRSSTASENSFGEILVSSQYPIVKLLIPVYVAYSPVPPPFFSNPNIVNAFLLIGNFWWYGILPSYLILIFYSFGRSDKLANLIKSSGFTFLFTLLIVSMTSMDPRHVQFIYPVALFGGAYCIKNYYKKLKRYIPLYLLAFILMFSVYLFLKGK